MLTVLKRAEGIKGNKSLFKYIGEKKKKEIEPQKVGLQMNREGEIHVR